MSNERTADPIVIKIGGAVLADLDALDDFWMDVDKLREQAPVVVVHGGGPQATDAARRLGHEPRIVHGRRITTDIDLEIVTWTLRGGLNAHLVAQAVRHGLPAIGISGADAGLLRVTRRPPWQVDGETVDFGWVGDVSEVNVDVLGALLQSGFLPVVAPLGIDDEGRLYNVNADTVACALARALCAAQFLLVTESGGVKRSPDPASPLLSRCDAVTFEAGRDEGWIRDGMRVKLQVAFEALRDGVPDVFILAPDDVLTRRRATQIVA